MEKTRTFYLHMLGSLLIYLRHLEDDDDLDRVKALAYVFHDLPSHLLSEFDSKQGEAIYKMILGRAEHFQLVELVKLWEKRSFDLLEDDN